LGVMKKLILRLRAYIRRLLFPLYFFPLKLLTYSSYYLLKFLLKLLLALIGLVIDTLIFPFRSLKNFLKSILVGVVVLYLFASLFVILDYLTKQYGYFGKFFCALGASNRLRGSVVRIVGGYSEGSGFFIAEDQVLTNFHVIADEPAPKIIFPDGQFTTPIKITGDKDADVAVLYTREKYPEKVLAFLEPLALNDNEPLISTGYPMGTDLSGEATVLKGNFVSFRQSKNYPVGYIQTNLSLVAGMSGGPLTDQCGRVVGVNTMGLAGLSFFIAGPEVERLVPGLTDQGIKKIKVDPSLSPEEAVKAFYTYLKARRMEDGFKLLSQEYLWKTNFEEWTNRFKDILDVNVIKAARDGKSKDTAFVKFSTKNWVDGEAEFHYYEGTWKTVWEDGVYKMLKSKIAEVDNPEQSWFYE